MDRADILRTMEEAVPAFPEEERRSPLSGFRDLIILRTRVILEEQQDITLSVQRIRGIVAFIFGQAIDDERRPDNRLKAEMRDTFLKALEAMQKDIDNASR